MRDIMPTVGFREEQRGKMSPSNGQEERIFVAIRVRPLNERERARHDVADWECISDQTIRFKNSGTGEQRSSDNCTFDRVFGDRCTTEQVYEEGIKEVALSVVRGINSSIFAYGQTSSGKTYTMTGITEYAIRDIYEYIEKHKEREFSVKFSAMEIYNEAVRDLLSANAASLRILDDPEKGTIIEKLTEETLKERSRLRQLLSICAAERTTEETAMNEVSSRSHQILRLTVESNPGNYVGTARSGTLSASVNFVDLAGSERTTQALSAGTRLREGSHINRSLLTLGTVIRKLSKGGNGHVPYRDSKLTRILHNSLGGNARTAIICTISPARSQVEQSKNTLFFAGCAKQVTTNAQVNVVMSDKVLVKQLQKELARMENELRSLNSIVLKDKEQKIEQMDKEIKELTRQRDLFHSHSENLVQSTGNDQLVRVDENQALETSSVANNISPERDSTSGILDRTTSTSSNLNELLKPENFEDNFLLDGCPPTFVEAESPDPCQGWEEIASRAEPEESCKEVQHVEREEVETDHKSNFKKTISAFEEKGRNLPSIPVAEEDAKSSSGNGHNDRDALPQKIEDHRTSVNTSIPTNEEGGGNSPMIPVADEDGKSSSGNGHTDQDTMTAMSPPQIDKMDQETSSHPQVSKLEEQSVSPSRFCQLDQEPASPHQVDEEDHKNMSPHQFDGEDLKTMLPNHVDEAHLKNMSPHQFVEEDLKIMPPRLEKQELKIKSPQLDEMEKVSGTSSDWVERDYYSSMVFYDEKQSELKLHAKKRKSSRKYSPFQVMGSPVEYEESVLDSDSEDSASVINFYGRMDEMAMGKPKSKPKPFSEDFDDLMAHVNKVKGANFHGVSGPLMPAKFEMQQREIIELWDTCNVPLVHRSYFFLLIKGQLPDAVYLDVEFRRLSFLKDTFSSGITGRGVDLTPKSSLVSLNREKKMLSKKVHKKFSSREREDLYWKWGIDLMTKHRSIQLAWLLWTDTKDLEHVRESAELVAKLTGLINSSETPKKSFGLGFLTKRFSRKSHSLKDTMSTI